MFDKLMKIAEDHGTEIVAFGAGALLGWYIGKDDAPAKPSTPQLEEGKKKKKKDKKKDKKAED